MLKNIFITTPIYYVNDEPHIGHAYTTTLADVLCRYYKLLGYDTYFLTGTDEHGLKVKQAALKRNVTPIEHVNYYHLRFINLWEKLGIKYNQFIRTTNSKHIEFVQKKLQELFDKGEIYTKTYSGWYSVGEERFFNDEEIVDGKDPINHKPLEWLEEKNYFFKMSAYQTTLVQYINEHADFILPEHRKNEVLGFLEKPLTDLCISRPKARLDWGITLPFDSNFTTYVWFDALLNYVSAVDQLTFKDKTSIWPAHYHLVGKDILTTHAVYWPCMLFALGLPLPKHILAHGWWLSTEEKKMSKSTGNAVNPLFFLEKYGSDCLRYFLIRHMNLGQDANFSQELFFQKINSELANDLGNTLSRVHKLLESHFETKIPTPGNESKAEEELRVFILEIVQNANNLLSQLKLSVLLEAFAETLRKLNQYIDTQAPWKIAKELNVNHIDTQNEIRKRLGTILYTCCEALRIILVLLHPVMPEKTREGLKMLGLEIENELTIKDLSWGQLEKGRALGAKVNLFPRIEI